MHDYRLYMYKFPKEIHNLQNNADGYKGRIMMDNITLGWIRSTIRTSADLFPVT